MDLVGYGTADCFEGSNKTAAHSNTTANFRKSGGCVDTNDNLADFVTSAPNPRNSSSAANDCSTGFRPDIKSYAAARGLMQFISTTANTIALKLNRRPFHQEDLYDPSTSILFGSQYLADLFAIFPGQPAAVAASYNGGDDNVRRWILRSKSDSADLYIPEIAYSQSKDYAYRVMANYRIYQYLYDENLKVRQ
jgi:hypothetical protein